MYMSINVRYTCVCRQFVVYNNDGVHTHATETSAINAPN